MPSVDLLRNSKRHSVSHFLIDGAQRRGGSCKQVFKCGFDIHLIAPTGTGKTLAYAIPAFVHWAHQARVAVGTGPVVLILVPSRELGQQIKGLLEKLSKNVPEYISLWDFATGEQKTVSWSERTNGLKKPNIMVMTGGDEGALR